MILAQLAALALVGDLAGDADAVQAGHQDEVAAGDADVGREGRPLGADALLDDLDEHLVAAPEDLLDGRLVADAALVESAASALVAGVFLLLRLAAVWTAGACSTDIRRR